MKKIKKQAGFTLIELVVVMAIMVMLASLAGWGILSWRKNSEWLKDEGYAKITFLAAQSALSNKNATNTLDDYMGQVKEEGTKVSSVKNLPKDYLGENTDDRIYYLSAKRGEYLDYSKGKRVSNQAKLIFDLLSSSMDEDSALNGAIVLEVDVKAGQIYSTFVGTWADSFTYQFLRSGERGDISITGDSEQVKATQIRGNVNYRKEHVFGYYTLGEVGEVASLSPKKLKVTSLEIENNQTLDLKFSSNSKLQNWDVIYKIDVYSKNQKLLFSTKLRGIDYQKGYDGITRLEVNGTTYEFPLTYDGTTYTLTLDAMVSSQVLQLNQSFQEIDTLSITRFLTKEDASNNIYATVQAQPFEVDDRSATRTDEAYKKFISEFGAFDYTTEEPRKSEEVCALYSNITEDKVVEIANFRHLNNIRYYNDKKNKTSFKLLNDLDWKDAIIYELKTEEGGALRLKKWEKSAQFPTIDTKFDKNWTFDGNHKSIKNLELGSLSEVRYSDNNKLEFKNEATNLAMFTRNDGSIQNIYFKNCNIYSEVDTLNGVALLCSTNEGTISGVTIDSKTTMSATLKESKQSGMGSIAGINQGGIIEGCVNEGSVEARGDNVGGLVGYNKDGKIVFSQKQSIQSVIGMNNVGGLVGFNDAAGEIELKSKLFVKKVIGTGDDIGGYIGKNTSATIFKNPIEVSCESMEGGNNVGGVIGENNIDVTKAITIQASVDKGVITAQDHVGGIFGSQQGLAVIKDSTNHMEINANGLAGGIVGFVAEKTSEDDEVSTLSLSDLPPIEVDVQYTLEISNTINYGKVYSKSGPVGGIISKTPQESKISECKNYADIGSKEGVVGGICGINNGGNILSCEIGVEETLQLSGKNIGILVGTNIGSISECTVGNKVSLKTDGIENLGGITADNQGMIKDCNVNFDFNDLKSITNLGGIAATNSFEISDTTYTGSMVLTNTEVVGGMVASNEGGVINCTVQLEKLNASGESCTVGGIVGKNNRSIETSTLVANKESKISIEQGRLGGIAGVNNGSIANCGATRSWEFVGGALNALESDITRIPDFTNDASQDTGIYQFEIVKEGTLGGIVAENGRDGSVKQCITGKNWILTGGNPSAGMIGVNKSGLENSELVNQATVMQSGIIGSQEVTSSNSWILEKCYNLGKVENKDGRAAGIISNVKYYGGTIRNCRNYGEIVGNKAAGILTGEGVSMQLMGCINQGTITATSKAAGISVGCGTSFVNCHNFATITSDSTAGIANLKTQAYFTQCANFGKLSSDNTAYAITNAQVGDTQCKYTMGQIPLTPLLTESTKINYIITQEFESPKEAYEFYVDYIQQESMNAGGMS